VATKRFKWIGFLFGLHAHNVAAAAPVDQIPAGDDLANAAHAAARECRPILLEFAAERCPYCVRLEQEFLLPMRRNPVDAGRVVMRRIVVDTDTPVIGFDQARTATDDLATRYAIKVTPTLLFLDTDGAEIAERMVGFNTPEFYGAYLNAAIDEANLRFRNQARCGGESDRP